MTDDDLTPGAPSEQSIPLATPVSMFTGHVVCIGASAGGLDALERFFRHCPNQTGAAFVVIQHLSPDHKSMMCNLLARHTRMPVVLVQDGMDIQPDRLHLIPPGSVMHVREGRLHLTPKNPHGLTLPIDIFFNALARACGPRAVGVILSGTGTDGTRGATALNEAGGFLMAQEPESASFDGMPRSVIATGLVDAVLPPEKLPSRLLSHLNKNAAPAEGHFAPIQHYATLNPQEVFSAILQLLHQIGGIDFSDYKSSTLMRRIDRRQQVRHTPALHQYLELLENDRAEVITLRRELLISVTSFFRDPETFNLLAEKVITPMVAAKSAGETIRVWIAGVATGEEAYSIGILFLEAFEKAHLWPHLKIFATDVDQQCVETAGMGQYPESAAAELHPERLERFFVRKDRVFYVKNDLRQCVVFARHNLLADPPFTKMDLVVCRNTLIYFNSSAQERALRSLQYALNDGGVLLLGSSESFAAVADGVHVISAQHKLFRRKGPPTLPPPVRRVNDVPRPLPTGKTMPAVRQRRQAHGVFSEAGLQALMARFAPPAMLVNAHHEVLHLYGAVSRYFRAKEGVASLDVCRLLPDELVPVASALLYKAERDRTSLSSNALAVQLPGEGRVGLRLSAHPVESADEECLTLLCFESDETVQDGAAETPAAINVNSETTDRLAILERELAATRENLQATIEELEAANEELQATNEEMMASNEELQSSNEELQSVNEEMSTVNAELQEKMLLLSRVNADLDSMAKAAGVATVFLDGHFNITRFSPDATQIFKLRETDLGRQLDDITHVLDYPELMEDLGRTLKLQRLLEREVLSADGKRTFLVRMLPYLVPSSTERGAVATFVDVTAIHDARRLQAIIDALPEHVAVVDPVGVICMVNAAWRRFARANGDPDMVRTGVGVNYLGVCQVRHPSDQSLIDTALKGLRQVLDGSLPRFSLEYSCHSPTEQRWFVMHAAPIIGAEYGAVISHVNITSWYLKEAS